MPRRILITGGAGFIGSHLATELLANGYEVRVLDDLAPQVHGPARKRPDYLDEQVELTVGNVEDESVLSRSLAGVDGVVHLAARVGVGQSMYDIVKYVRANTLGTAALLEALIERPVERLVVASSMSVYGEGLYCGPDGRPYDGVCRTYEQLEAGSWEPRSEADEPLQPLPTPETKRPSLESVYALSKYDQERLCLMVGRAYDIPTVALRLFNVYGPHQALSNPYTGVLAIFASRYLNGRPPVIFEDGGQLRDFVNVRDVARACRAALEAPAASQAVFNIGSGRALTVAEVATRMAAVLNATHIEPEITGSYRVGDVRHCFADIGLAGEALGFAPEVTFDAGLAELAEWLQDQPAVDHVGRAREELLTRGLAI